MDIENRLRTVERLIRKNERPEEIELLNSYPFKATYCYIHSFQTHLLLIRYPVSLEKEQTEIITVESKNKAVLMATERYKEFQEESIQLEKEGYL